MNEPSIFGVPVGCSDDNQILHLKSILAKIRIKKYVTPSGNRTQASDLPLIPSPTLTFLTNMACAT